MNFKLYTLGAYLLFIPLIASLFSCSKDRDPAPSLQEEGSGLYMMFNIRSLSSRATNPEAAKEMIQSLRIVIVDMQNQIIENNHYIPFNGSEVSEPLPVSGFQYFYTWETEAGLKKVFLIANEAQVTNVTFQPENGVTLPDNIGTDLSGILNSENFQSGSENGATELINVLDAICFVPNYQPDTNNYVYLPYVSSYEENVSREQGSLETINLTTYLVPVATKFTFQFNNYRPNPVYIQEILLDKTDSTDFLFARVGENDLYKDLTDLDGNEYEDLYWIDWLAKVAQFSNGYTGYYPNLGFNELFGWISDYSMPDGSALNTRTFFSMDSDAGVEVPAVGVDQLTPGVTIFGPYYVPESYNQIDTTLTGSDDTDQMYYLTINFFEDIPNPEKPDFTSVGIDNLKALFRNTNVVINVNMFMGEVEIYAEIADWSEKFANGWVVKQ